MPCPNVDDKSLIGVGAETKFLCFGCQAASSLMILTTIHFLSGCKSHQKSVEVWE